MVKIIKIITTNIGKLLIATKFSWLLVFAIPFCLVLLLIWSFNISTALATDYTNSNFILRNPAITISGGRSTSSSFEFYSSVGQSAPGQSTNSSFTYQSGFLYFDDAAAATPSPAPAPNAASVGGGTVPSGPKVIFSGKAYPNSTVLLLKDAQIAKTVLADINANFSIEVSNLSLGDYIFSLYAKDYAEKSSRLLLFPIKGLSSKGAKIENILIPPTISKNKREVKKDDTIDIFGQSVPNSQITLIIETPNGKFSVKTPSDNQGKYKYVLSTLLFDYGEYIATAEVSFENTKSKSPSISFIISDQNVLEELHLKPLKGDLNRDGSVNLIDFSILIYWFDKSDVPSNIDLNSDGKADLVDFSIMAYYWTG